MADSEWLSKWKEEFRHINDAEIENGIPEIKRENTEAIRFMKEALESDGDGKIPGLQVRYDVVSYDGLRGREFFSRMVTRDRIVINIGDANPEFLSDMDFINYCNPENSFIVSPEDISKTSGSRDITLAFLDRFMDERVDYNVGIDKYPETYTVTGVSEESGLCSPKDSEGNYVSVIRMDLGRYIDKSDNAGELCADLHYLKTPAEYDELRAMSSWMESLDRWNTEFHDLECRGWGKSIADYSDSFRAEKANAAAMFMDEVLDYADRCPGKDWVVSDIYAKYEQDNNGPAEKDRLMFDITDSGRPFKRDRVFTVSPSELAKDPESRKTMTKFLERFTDMTADDLDKRLEETGKKSVSRNPLPDEWKDMAAGSFVQNTDDKDYGD